MEFFLKRLILLSGVLLLAASVQGCSPASTRYRAYRVNRVAQETGCSFDLDRNSPDHQPHIVSEGVIVQPELQNDHRVITLTENEHVTIACEGNVITTFNSQFVNATCQSGSLTVNEQSYPYSSLGCDSKIKPSIRENGKCGPENEGVIIEIGWQVWDAWINQITVCHNLVRSSSFYTVHTLIGKSIAAKAKETGQSRSPFRKGGYFNEIDIDRAFKDQFITASRVMGNLTPRYIDQAKGSRYLARSHLSPWADFMDEGSQNATQYYLNVLPQWQQVNNGLWGKLEERIRELAARRRANFTIYTGGFGSYTVSTEEGAKVPFYLGPDPDTPDQVPVPKFFWKVVLDTASQTGTAFITINDPYKTGLEEGDVICKDRCSSVTSININERSEFHGGYTYCCTLEDLKNAVPFAPRLILPLLA